MESFLAFCKRNYARSCLLFTTRVLGSSGSFVEQMEGGSHVNVNSIEETIEKSKSHWSQLGEFHCDSEVAEVSNVEFFKTLQGHPTWGTFFITFGKGEGSVGDLVMGEKFAEGGQAELYEVQIKWYDPEVLEDVQKRSTEYVLKVFKKEASLHHLQSQWPEGLLQYQANKIIRGKLGLDQLFRLHCEVVCGTLLEDGRFAFVMVKEREDLRSMINHRMLTRSSDEGPFSKRVALEAMYDLASAMNQLHVRGIVHRDIKASNVLVARDTVAMVCRIADFECSIGVVGTGFFRAPEILQACKLGNVNAKAEIFTKAVDVYSYGMTCYEILTGKLPFEGYPRSEFDFVLQGQRPELPNHVDGWIQKLVNRCWHADPKSRPSFHEILETLVANSEACRKLNLHCQNLDLESGIRKPLDRSSKVAEMWNSLQLRLWLPKLKMFRS